MKLLPWILLLVFICAAANNPTMYSYKLGREDMRKDTLEFLTNYQKDYQEAQMFHVDRFNGDRDDYYDGGIEALEGAIGVITWSK